MSYRDLIEQALAESAERARKRRNWRLEQLGYRAEVTKLDDGAWYWHLFRRGERINGGLSTSRAEALAAADWTANVDSYRQYHRPVYPGERSTTHDHSRRS